MTAKSDSLAEFARWIGIGLVGGLAGICLISALFPLLIIVVPLLIFLATRVARTESGIECFGFIVGASLMPLILAYVHRNGPTADTQTETGDHYNPRVFLATAALMIVIGVGGYLIGRFRGQRRFHSVAGGRH